ncbi:MAG TPA: TonB-dependent receptor [Steroidobacteraceae bacterium]|nr:TonB-dependent receptor [Steroidobacteraceae bacterium]
MADKWTRRRSARGAGVALACISSYAIAQTANEPSEGEAELLETVVVTAQKREQDLQDVPVTVTAIGAQLLKDSGVRDIKDLTLLTPGLLVTSSQSEVSTTARIRGIGTVGDNIGLESSVGVVIDGVYRPRNGVGFGELGELERIEVLKGPQGTLFGKNTSAGVINVITKRPEFEFGSDVAISGGSWDALDMGGSVTGPIIDDQLAGRFYVSRQKRDGYYDVNTGDGTRTATQDANRDAVTARGQLLFTPSDDVSALFIADYARRSEDCCAAVQINDGPSAALIDAVAADSGVSRPADPFARIAYLDRPTDQDINDKGLSVELGVDTYFGQLTSITAWRQFEATNGQDADYTTADIVWRDSAGANGNEFNQLSQELRFSGETNRLNWLVGAFYAAEDLDSNMNLTYGADFETYYSLALSGGTAPTLVNTLTGLPAQSAYGAGAGYQDHFEQRSDSLALFTHNTFRFTEKLAATVGARYTQETKDLDSAYTNSDGGAGCAASRERYSVIAGALPAAAVPAWYAFGCGAFADPIYNNLTTSQSIDEDDFSGTLKLAYNFTPHLMSYLSYARGYKASGFNLDRERNPVPPTGVPGPPLFTADSDTSFKPEIVDSYELGTKFQTSGRRFRMNTALFSQDFQDFQLNTFTGTAFVVVSIPEVTSQGVDFDFDIAPIENLVFNAGVTYAKTEYGDFTPPFASLYRLPNAQMSFAPEWSGSVAATYEHDIGSSLLWRFNVGTKYTSEYNTGSDLNPAKLQDALTLVNARFVLGSQDKRWMLEAWAQNLTNEEYYQVVFDATLQTGTYDANLGAPRSYGLTARFSF